MSKAETVFQHAVFDDRSVSKVNNFTGHDLTTNTYYFKPGQSMGYQSTAGGDQVYVVLQGEGQFYLNNGQEETIDVESGSIMYIPKGVSFKIVNNQSSDLICTGVQHPAHQ
ncbi:cupin domain-containing protein [Effusibacillus dendaii]|uniref:Cupin n=1 Tax=Effusibacillus dendaii TaxID=2743772 RepID=A0A7I8DEL7_9BACL|nr:cupin domain-containing protein [Effusibacillus dendaii]BCJ86990.1 cupin [Effusibacillus dendaii]